MLSHVGWTGVLVEWSKFKEAAAKRQSEDYAKRIAAGFPDWSAKPRIICTECQQVIPDGVEYLSSGSLKWHKYNCMDKP